MGEIKVKFKDTVHPKCVLKLKVELKLENQYSHYKTNCNDSILFKNSIKKYC